MPVGVGVLLWTISGWFAVLAADFLEHARPVHLELALASVRCFLFEISPTLHSLLLTGDDDILGPVVGGACWVRSLG